MNLRGLVDTWTRHLLGERDSIDTNVPPDRVPMPALTTGLDRRRFLGIVLGGAAGAAIASTVDLDQLLWMPGEKTILIPEVVELNELVTMDWLMAETLRVLQSKLQLTSFYNDAYDRRLGDTVQVPQPQRFRLTEDYPSQSIVTAYRPVTLDQAIGVHFNPTQEELARCSTRRASEIYAHPAAACLAEQIRERHIDVVGQLSGVPPYSDNYVELRHVHDPASGLSLCGMRYFDVVEREHKIRIDLLGGSSTHPHPRWDRRRRRRRPGRRVTPRRP